MDVAIVLFWIVSFVFPDMNTYVYFGHTSAYGKIIGTRRGLQ